MKTQAYKEKEKRHHKRWLKKHPEFVLKRLKIWVEREKNPQELERAKAILKRHQEEAA